MSIGAVSSINRYSRAYESALFGTTVSNQRLDELMQEYGIIQTGDSYVDLLELYNAMYKAAQTTVTAAATKRQTGRPPEPITTNTIAVPWQSLMVQVGLETTGDVAVDYAAFNRQIFFMQGAVRSKQDEADIAALFAQANISFNQQTQQMGITGSGATKLPSISGADIVAQMNRMFM